MSQPLYRTSGPVFWSVLLPGESSWRGLGTCTTSPEINFRPRTLECFNDIAGRTLPGQRTWDGEDATVGGTFTRFSELTYQLIRTQPFHNGGGFPAVSSPGIEPRTARGSLMIGRSTFQLALAFSYYNSQNAAQDGQDIPGYRFFAAHLAGHVTSPLGTQAREIGLIFQCDPVLRPDGSWALYDHDAALLTSLAPT